jgi:hypothetical protein
MHGTINLYYHLFQNHIELWRPEVGNIEFSNYTSIGVYLRKKVLSGCLQKVACCRASDS